MELIDYVLQHPVAFVAHRSDLTAAHQKLIQDWQQDPYVMFTNHNKLVHILRALPAFAEDLENCAESILDRHEVSELATKIAHELPSTLVRWERYTPLAKAVESFYATARSVPLDGQACRSGRLLEEILSAKTFRLATTSEPTETMISDYIAYAERFIDTIEYYEEQQPQNQPVTEDLRERLLNLEVTSLVASIHE
jgi:hypothetical protein